MSEIFWIKPDEIFMKLGPVTFIEVLYIFRTYLLVDPTDREEKVMDGRMVIGMNKHREICTLQITGQMLLLKDQVSVYRVLGTV
mgnify:CR=1 FL=1